MSTTLQHSESSPAEAETLPERSDPAPSGNEDLVCTLCGLNACWTAKPARPA